jgi:DNA-binding beta-propeller fold protein YncE
MNRIIIICVLLLALTAPMATWAAGPSIVVGAGPSGLALAPDGTLYVTQGDGYILSAVAPDRKVRQVGVGAVPLPPVIDASLGRVFVAGRADATLSAVDIGALRVGAQVTLPAPPTAIAADVRRHLLYVAMQPNLLAIVDAGSLKVVAQTTVGWNPVALAVDQERGRVAVLGHDSSTLDWVGAGGDSQGQVFVGVVSSQLDGVSVSVDPTTHRPNVRKHYEQSLVQTSPVAVVLDPASGAAYVLNELNGQLVVVHERDIVARYRAGVRPRALALHDGHAYIASWGSNSLADLHLADGAVREVPIGYAPGALALDAARGRLFVAEEGRDSVSVVGLSDLSARRGDVGRGPVALALDPASGRVFVANHGGDSVSVVEP